MKERPILFSGPMVRAILDGRKTQTRRIVKLSPTRAFLYDGSLARRDDDRCPYGVVGDRLWVRECFAYLACEAVDAGARPWGDHDIHGGDFEGERGCEAFRVAYKASGDPCPEVGDRPGWRPSIHMPRWASRITLEITDGRVQRLDEITTADIWAEGVDNGKSNPTMGVRHDSMQRMAFEALWDEINGDGAWAANPWVWALTFKRVEQAQARGAA